jgi:hypothetical protein
MSIAWAVGGLTDHVDVGPGVERQATRASHQRLVISGDDADVHRRWPGDALIGSPPCTLQPPASSGTASSVLP